MLQGITMWDYTIVFVFLIEMQYDRVQSYTSINLMRIPGCYFPLTKMFCFFNYEISLCSSTRTGVNVFDIKTLTTL